MNPTFVPRSPMPTWKLIVIVLAIIAMGNLIIYCILQKVQMGNPWPTWSKIVVYVLTNIGFLVAGFLAATEVLRKYHGNMMAYNVHPSKW